MTRTETDHGFTRTINVDTDRATSHRAETGGVWVVFGRVEGAEFIVAYSKTSRTYKTTKGAQRAIKAWTA